jgi:PAS domain-containing protein
VLTRSRWVGVPFGLALVGLAVLLRYALGFHPGDGPMAVVFVIPVILGAFLGGWPGGLVTTLAASVAVDWLFMVPLGSLSIARTDNRVQWLALWAVGILVTLLVEWTRGAQAAAERERERLAVTLRSIGDAVIATDAGARVTLLNPAAEALTDWSAAEAVGRPLGEVFLIVDEGSQRPRESPVERVLREGRVVGLATTPPSSRATARPAPSPTAARPSATRAARSSVWCSSSATRSPSARRTAPCVGRTPAPGPSSSRRRQASRTSRPARGASSR